MTLDEAIEHLQEKFDKDDWPCEECRQEHIQLLYWLIELRDRRKFGNDYIQYHTNKMIDELNMLEQLLKEERE